ncbi:hypothetical protein GCK72_001207 [Caenorhabditis remanei]|uniref:Uncharacterized protein n=1 Tax=Caenorhabditis remanei TaxID=31234 RepID=A0A6A5HMD6_CAERE|nr:hypothetical protein GCK72_001207 [Caenorhabditis remanei]KAF1769390.1 hypothetical protein GCK72_001207 [Caenorhabditis remanei]
MSNRQQGSGQQNYRRFYPQQQRPPNTPLYVDTGSYQGPPRRQNYPNEVDPGMNGDGWQGPGGRGGAHHMNGGGGGGNRRGGGGGYNQRMPPSQHHGNMNRMMPPAFRPQQQQYMPPYGPPMGGMPSDVMDLNMRMDGMSMSSTPTMPGQFGDMGPPVPPPPQQWNQPAPFAAPPPQQDDLYDPTGGYGVHHHQMPPYAQQQQQRGNGGQNQYGNRMNQGGNRGYQQRQQGGYMQPMMVPQNQQQFYGGNQNHQQQPPFAPSPFSMTGSQTSHDHHMGGGGNHGPNGNFGGSGGGGSSQMDDYSMWTDENDEEAKRKKTLRDKGLLAWGDAETSNSKPIRRWIVPEGHEEDFDTAMERCPSHLKKKALNEEALRRRLGSDNPQIAAQAQQQAEEEANATLKIGRRPIIPCGWGDLPSELGGDKNEFDQGSSKGWDDGGLVSGGSGARHHQQHQQQNEDNSSLWNNPISGGPSSNETRNPFFAHHMQQHQQQQQQQQQHQQHYSQGVYGDNGVLDGGSVWSAVMDGSPMGPPPPMSGGPSSSSAPMPIGMLSMMTAGGGPMSADVDGSQSKLAENLKLAVEKGHLDISLLSLPHIPPNVLDLLTEILTVIPRLDNYEDELKKLGDNRPSNSEEGTSQGEQETTWMNKDQKNEHEKAVIGVVTAKIEVTQLSKKITEALVEAGLIPAPPPQLISNPNHHHHGGPPPGSDGAGPSTSGGGDYNGGGGPPDHYYDYSFLG